jgi:hypothetical protein
MPVFRLCVRFATVPTAIFLWKKFFLGEMALFPPVVRVSGCGLFFASQRQSSVLSFSNFGNCVARNSLDTFRFIRTSKIKAMSEKKTIRIIKKGEKSRPIVKAKAASARETARDMVETVTNWVTEFQQKHRNETSNALRILSKTPRGSEA